MRISLAYSYKFNDMKYLLYVLIFAVVAFHACNNLTDEAIKYNDHIITKQQKIVSLFNKLDSSFSDTVHKSFITNYEKLQHEIELQIKQTDSLKPFNGSTEFKEKYKTLLQAYLEVLTTDYKKMIDWYSLPDILFTQQIADSFTQTYQNANQKIEQAVNEFIEFQNKFAKEYHFTLVKYEY